MEEQEQKMSNGVNKTIITIVIVAVVLAGGYFFLRSSQSSRETSPPPILGQSNGQTTQQSSADQTSVAEEKVVTYTDSGYSPTVLGVKAGDAIIFKNRSSQSMWTASAIHPAHREYPTTGGCIGSTFDACSGAQPGGSWQFKFDIKGAWKYHNHLNPGDTGTVIVE